MKKAFWLLVTLFLSASFASAQATRQKWTAGWDFFNEPLNHKKSWISWTVIPEKSKLALTFTLVGATPNKLYQVSATIFCTTFPATWGQFPSIYVGTCPFLSRQGVTRTYTEVPLGVVMTDIHGNGTFRVVVGPIATGTYELEFGAIDGAGCGEIGGSGRCWKDFQAPGPFGTAITINIP